MRNLLTLIVASQMLLACSSTGVTGASKEDDKATLQMMWEEIYKLIDDLSCGDSSECTAIGAGAKPCGGPWRYLVYSKSTVDEELLRAKVEELYAFERIYNRTYRILSDCALAHMPSPGCVESLCVDTTSLP